MDYTPGQAILNPTLTEIFNALAFLERVGEEQYKQIEEKNGKIEELNQRIARLEEELSSMRNELADKQKTAS